jgi:hypothetical protein
VTLSAIQTYYAAMPSDGTVIATGIEAILAALSAAGVPDDGTIDDMIGSARLDGGSRYGALRVVYEDLTTGLSWMSRPRPCPKSFRLPAARTRKTNLMGCETGPRRPAVPHAAPL